MRRKPCEVLSSFIPNYSDSFTLTTLRGHPWLSHPGIPGILDPPPPQLQWGVLVHVTQLPNRLQRLNSARLPRTAGAGVSSMSSHCVFFSTGKVVNADGATQGSAQKRAQNRVHVLWTTTRSHTGHVLCQYKVPLMHRIFVLSDASMAPSCASQEVTPGSGHEFL